MFADGGIGSPRSSSGAGRKLHKVLPTVAGNVISHPSIVLPRLPAGGGWLVPPPSGSHRGAQQQESMDEDDEEQEEDEDEEEETEDNEDEPEPMAGEIWRLAAGRKTVRSCARLFISSCQTPRSSVHSTDSDGRKCLFYANLTSGYWLHLACKRRKLCYFQ